MNAVQVIDSFAWPRMPTPYEVGKINRAMAKGISLFSEALPTVETLRNQRGEEYKAVTNTDYRALRLKEPWEIDGRTVIAVCRNPVSWVAYRAACASIEEEARIELYLVDMDQQTCTCEAFKDTGSYCKHLLGLAYWLRVPHRISAKGIIRWSDPERERS